MKFSQYEYERPNLEDLQAELDSITDTLKRAESFEEFEQAFDRLIKTESHFETMSSLAGVHYTINTADSFWSGESDFYDASSPVFASKAEEAFDAVLESKYRDLLEAKIPACWFAMKQNERDTLDDAIVEDLKKENELASRYQRLVASGKAEFEGKTWTLNELSAIMSDSDRERRKGAHLAYWGWFEQNEQELSSIYDQLVQVRTRMARKMGYENYLPFGYKRMNRLDYDWNDVADYRKEILRTAVPLANRLYEAQKKRLGVQTLKPWDEKMEFSQGMPKPVLDQKGLVDAAADMYRQLSPYTGEFFEVMKAEELMDLPGRENKAAGGYCTSFADFHRPFIFSNFNGTKDDVEVLTHEAGHAFQYWQSRNILPPDLAWPTMESAEIHSMSMEFLTWPWMDRFFGDQADRFRYAHLADAIKFLPYGALVDHFQHEVYANPQWSGKERMDAWRRLEKEYLPCKDYEDIDFLERGGWWMRQLHIFLDPLYYIDYTLAQCAALQFWKRMIDQDPALFEDYLKICKIGGTKTFSGILKEGNLKNPMEKGCLKETMDKAQWWFDQQEDPGAE